MRSLNELRVTEDFCALVSAMTARLGTDVVVVADDRWRAFAGRLNIVESDDAKSAAVVVGSPASVLRHAATSADEFGFVMPVAQIARAWQREPSWRDDATLDLWRAGWSILAVDRPRLHRPDASVEFAIGNVRLTPSVPVP